MTSKLGTITVFSGVEGGRRRVLGGEEEEPAVDRDSGGHQRNELERVESKGQVRLSAVGEESEEQNHYKHTESLNQTPSCFEDDRDQDHPHLPEHNHTLPKVSRRLEPVVQEPILETN